MFKKILRFYKTLPLGIKIIMATYILGYLVLILPFSKGFAVSHFGLFPKQAFGKEPWQFISNNFLILNPIQLLIEALFLYLFALDVERRLGTWRFLRLVLASTLTAGLVAGALGYFLFSTSGILLGGTAVHVAVLGYLTQAWRHLRIGNTDFTIRGSTFIGVLLAIQGLLLSWDKLWPQLGGVMAATVIGILMFHYRGPRFKKLIRKTLPKAPGVSHLRLVPPPAQKWVN